MIINFKKLAVLLLPVRIRGKALVTIIQCAIAPLEKLQKAFIDKKDNALFLLKYDASKRNIEIALRRHFDNDGIYIQNAVKQEGLYLDFYLEEGIKEAGYERVFETAYIEKYLNFYIDAEVHTDDFTVYVPKEIYAANRVAIYDYTGLFALSGMNYSVKEIND